MNSVACWLCALSLALSPLVAIAQSTPAWPLPEGFEPGSAGSQDNAGGSTEGDFILFVTFSEAEFPLGTQVDGLVVTTLDGGPIFPLSFGFTVGGKSSMDATINVGPPDQSFVQPPGVEGDAQGVLSIDFGTDVTSAGFGFALSCAPPVSPGATLTAFDAAMNPVGMVSADAVDTGFPFAENELIFNSATPFRSIEVTFNDNGGLCGRLLLDNLSYDPFTGGGASVLAIPTLGATGLGLLALLLLAAALLALRRRRAGAAP